MAADGVGVFLPLPGQGKRAPPFRGVPRGNPLNGVGSRPPSQTMDLEGMQEEIPGFGTLPKSPQKGGISGDPVIL